MTTSKIHDVCVIGTGAGGGVMIQELCKAGFEVVALQRGPFLTTKDFTDDELSTIIRDEVFSPDQLETYRFDAHSPSQTGRFNLMAYCVGGTMTHWAAWSWRFRPEDFRVRSTEGPVEGASLADWPFDYAELEPFYEKAERDFGVAGDAKGNPFGAPRKSEYPNPAHPNRVSSLRFAEGARKLGYHPFPVPMAINSRTYRGRPKCRYGGNCQAYGCPVQAKATSLSVCIPRAQATRKLDLRANAMVVRIKLGEDGRARSVVYLNKNGKEREVLARHVVLAGNAIGSPHLLLMSACGSFPQGLANSSGLVGRNLTFHLHPGVGLLIDEPAMGISGFEAHQAVDDLHASDPKRGFIRGGVVAELNTLVRQPLVYALQAGLGYEKAGRGWGAEFMQYLKSFPRAMTLSGILEDLPVEENGIDLDPHVRDRYGLPVARITHRQHPNDLAMLKWYNKQLLELANACRATQTWVSKIPGVTQLDEHTAMRGNLHFHGTCRAGLDSRRSVLDRWCRSHDVKNLWVVDGSFFPTAGGYNPTLTILANAYRVAAHFISEAKRASL